MTAADLLASGVRELDALLTKIPDGRWDTPADNMGWSCRRTADHIAGDFAHYAGQVVGQPENHYVKFSFDTSRAETGLELAEVVSVAGALLVAAARTGSSDSRGWHPHGLFSPSGFAAIGAAEALVHGHDIASGLGMEWEPDPQSCRQVLEAVFPAVADASSPFEQLLHQTGRRGGVSGPWNYSAAAFPVT